MTEGDDTKLQLLYDRCKGDDIKLLFCLSVCLRFDVL